MWLRKRSPSCRHKREPENAKARSAQTNPIKKENTEGLETGRTGGQRAINDQRGTQRADKNKNKVGSVHGTNERQKTEVKITSSYE